MNKSNFTKNLHKLAFQDDNRPGMNYIYFDDDYVWVTDAHLLLKQHISFHKVIDPENLNGKAIHFKTFQVIKQRYKTVIARENDIKCLDDWGNEAFFSYGSGDNSFLKSMKDIIPTGESKEIDEIGMNPKIITQITNEMFQQDEKAFKFSFYGKNKTILITANEVEKQLGIVMPVMIYEN